MVYDGTMTDGTGRPLAATTVNLSSGKSNYYFTVYALTPKEATSDQQQEQIEAQVLQESPLLPSLMVYAPFLLFFALFIGAFGIQVVNKAWTLKRTMIALVIALFAASIPFALSTMQQGSLYQAKAGPDEVPRNVRIQQLSRTNTLVTWDTEADKIGAVRVGLAPLTDQTGKIVIGDLGKQVKVHTVHLEDLKLGSDYELEIFSGTTWYTDNGKVMKLRLLGR